jgi:hypothetical protein
MFKRCFDLNYRRSSTLARDVKAKLASLSTLKTPPNTVPLPPRKKPQPGTIPDLISKHQQAMKASFPEGWNPPRKLSRDAMEGLRVLHNHNPEQYTTPVLAAQFRISPEAVRRILKSKWQPSEEQRAEMFVKERQGRLELKSQRRVKEWEETKQTEVFESAKRRRKQENDGFTLT